MLGLLAATLLGPPLASAVASCTADLESLCGPSAETLGASCLSSCVAHNQHQLRTAGCSVAAVKAWCDADDGISVVEKIPGRAASAHYSVSARPEAGGAWVDAFVLETTAKNDTADGTPGRGYNFQNLDAFTSSWVNVMLGRSNTAGVRLRVARIEGRPITKAAVRPTRSGASVVSISPDGVVELMVPGAHGARFTLSVDGGLEDVDTGPGYRGPPIHTFSAFVNPFHAPPDKEGAGVLAVQAGGAIPTPLPAGTTTVVFGAGEHRRDVLNPGGWPFWSLPDAVRVHIPADAVLYFALTSKRGANVTLDGYGAVSGEEMTRCDPAEHGKLPCKGNASPQGLTINSASQATVLGTTLIDFPNHHVIAGCSAGDKIKPGCSAPCHENPPLSRMIGVKVMGWRPNGDGIHVFGHWLVKDCFLRTQDDSIYLSTSSSSSNQCPTRFEGITTWNDANGAAYMLIGHNSVLRASDAIYQRAKWAWWNGGRILTNRQQGSIVNVTVDDLVASDPFPTMDAINIDNRPGSASGSAHNGPAATEGLTIRNFHVAAFSSQKKCSAECTGGGGCSPDFGCTTGRPLPYGLPNIITASVGDKTKTNNITSLAFENCSIGGVGMAELLSGGGGSFNVTWGAVVGSITVDGTPIQPPSLGV